MHTQLRRHLCRVFLALFFFPALLFGQENALSHDALSHDANSHDVRSSLVALVGRENAAALLEGKTLSRQQGKRAQLQLLPADDWTAELLRKTISEIKPSFFVETVRLYRKGNDTVKWSGSERTALFNNALAISSLAGLQYFSPSRGENRTFYETSTVVSGADGKKPLPDPVFETPPEKYTLFAKQKDLSFGTNVYRYDYYARDNVLVFVQENLTQMSYGIIPAVGKGKLRSVVAVFDAGPFLVFYAASMAKAASLPGINNRVGRSFSARVEAVLQWYGSQADKIF